MPIEMHFFPSFLHRFANMVEKSNYLNIFQNLFLCTKCILISKRGIVSTNFSVFENFFSLRLEKF